MSVGCATFGIFMTVSIFFDDADLRPNNLNSPLNVVHPLSLACFVAFYVMLVGGGYPAANVRWTFNFLNASVETDSIALSGRFLSTPILFMGKIVVKKVLNPGACQGASTFSQPRALQRAKAAPLTRPIHAAHSTDNTSSLQRWYCAALLLFTR